MERWLDARVVDARTLEMDLRDTLRNPWGILHGGVIAALVDAASKHATGGGRVTRRRAALPRAEPHRPGARRPRRSSAAAPTATCVRVEVRDDGADRVTAVAVATAAVDCTGRLSSA